MTISPTTSLGVPSGLFLAGLLAWGASSTQPGVFHFPGASAPATRGVPVAVKPSSAPSELQTDEASETDRVLGDKVELLRKGREFLASVPSYTGEITKREVVDGELLDEQVISLKYRHQPMSVYLQWLAGDVGREVLYVEGANNGKLLAHDGGWKARLPAFWLSPDSSLALRDTRYPITMAGVQGLLDLMLEIHDQDLQYHRAESCQVQPGIDHGGRICSVFTTYYPSPEISPTYRKSITWIDQEWKIPIKSLHYEWPRRQTGSDVELDETTMIESYEFSRLDFDQSLTDDDFDRHHADYRFR